MSTDWNAEEEPKPLKLTCTSSDCKNNLHCFKPNRKMKAANQFGQCRECDVELIDWSRVHKRCIDDATYTFEALKNELFRYHMWHVEISQKAINYALRKGKIGIPDAAEKQIRKLVGPAEPYKDGTQTYREDRVEANAIHYAQHATASCCRKCIEYWHNIPQGRDLTQDEIAYLAGLVSLYIEERLPQLTDQAQKVSPIRRQPSENSSTE
jgi:hypothetical protein